MKSRGFSNARDDALMMTDADCEDHVQSIDLCWEDMPVLVVVTRLPVASQIDSEVRGKEGQISQRMRTMR